MTIPYPRLAPTLGSLLLGLVAALLAPVVAPARQDPPAPAPKGEGKEDPASKDQARKDEKAESKSAESKTPDPKKDEPKKDEAPKPEPPSALTPEWVKGLSWRCIGPANMGGRIVAMSVYEADPSTFWVATGGGGLLKTENNGVSFEHQFDRENTVSIGDVCVAPSDNRLSGNSPSP